MGTRERGILSFGAASSAIGGSTSGWSEDDCEVRFGEDRRAPRGFGLASPENIGNLQHERQPFGNYSTPTRIAHPFPSLSSAMSSHERERPRALDSERLASNAATPPPAKKIAVPLRPAGSSLVSNLRSESSFQSDMGYADGYSADGARSRARRFGPDASMLSSSSLRLGDSTMPGHAGSLAAGGAVRQSGDTKKKDAPTLDALSRGVNRMQTMVSSAFESLRFRVQKNPEATASSGSAPASLNTALRSSLRKPRRREGSGRDAPIVLLGSDEEEEEEEEEESEVEENRVAIVDSGVSPGLLDTCAPTLKPLALSTSTEACNFSDSDVVRLMGGDRSGSATEAYYFGADGVPVPVWEVYLPGRVRAAFVTRPVAGHEDAKSCSEIVFKRPIRALELRLFHSLDKYQAPNDPISDISDVFCRKEILLFSFDSIKSIRCGSLIGSSADKAVGDTRFVAMDARPESADHCVDLMQILTVFDEDSYRKFIREAFSITNLSGKIEFVNNLDDIASLRLARAAAGIRVLLSSPPRSAHPSTPVTIVASGASVAERLRSKRRRSSDELLVQDLTKRPESSASILAPDKVLFVFPMEKKALDVITIMSCDRDRLMHSDCLNDNLIDLRLRLVVSGTSASDYATTVRKSSCNAKFDGARPVSSIREPCSAHAFSCHFYSLLSKRGSNKDQRTITAMCKNVDIFNLDFLFIPIHQAGHWSLVCVVRPGILARQRNKDISKAFSDSSQNRSCLLHLDSLSLHSTSSVLSNVAAFFSEEFARRTSAAQPAAAEQLSQHSPSSSDRKPAGLRVFNKAECPFVKCKQVCQQENGVDCGVFVIKYVEMILSANPTSTPEDICTEFHDYFQPLMFSQTDADVERIKFINDIDVLSECWSELCRRREALRRERATGLRCAGSTSTVRISSVPVDEGNAEETESSDDSSKPEEEGPSDLTSAEKIAPREDWNSARDRGSCSSASRSSNASSNIKAALAGLITRKVNATSHN